jgi:ubiquinone biosynthesis protein UbiJ
MALTSGAVNRVLADEPWARERLAAHAGRAFSVRVGPLTTAFRIDGQGTLASAPLAGTTPDLVLTLSPFNVPAFLANPARWAEFVTEEGDVGLGGTLKELAQTLPWFVEKLSARAFGTIVGQRVADAGRRALELPEYASRRIGENVGTYARDEVEWLAHPADMRALGDDAQVLEKRIDELGARVESLALQVAEVTGRPSHA